ncbi:MAG: hypothetical protein NWF00_08715 [Candidatus Bathyarchaeota archaeon]|nr:hypothetical protein [Candidatus Bathyarchaeota archaeon]
MDTCGEHVENLIALGLTLNEARVFVALYRLGTATARATSKFSGIPREIVYQAMAKLQGKRLVGEVLASPKAFRALSIEEVYEILLEQKKNKDKQLHTKIKKAIKSQQHPESPQINDAPTTFVTPRGKNREFIVKEYKKARISVDMIIPLNKFIQWSQTSAEECIDGVMKGNAKIRVITEKPVRDSLSEGSHIFDTGIRCKLQKIEYRFTEGAPQIEMAIFDRKTVFIAMCEEKLMKNMVWLRSNNAPIVEMANKYFETSWKESEQPKDKTLASNCKLVLASS